MTAFDFTEAEPGEPTTFGSATWTEVSDGGRIAERFKESTDNFDRYMQMLRRDSLIFQKSGRWNVGTPDPTTYVPGDVCATRAIVGGSLLQEHLGASAQFQSAANDDEAAPWLRRSVVSITCAGSLLDAVPHFIDADTVDGLARSQPPPPEAIESLRLPYQTVLVHFGAEFQLPEKLVVPSGTAFDIDARLAAVKAPSLSPFRLEVDEAILARGGSVTGLVLFSGPDGTGISDEFLWLVSAEPDPEQPSPANLDRQRGALTARLHSCLLRDAVLNLAAATAWMDWRRPDEADDLPASDDNKAWRKMSRTSRFKKQERHGAFGGVHIIDLGSPATPGRSSEQAAEPSRASPTTHIRRGHWRSVRVVERDQHGTRIGSRDGVEGVDWHYEGRWIAPSVVNAGGRRSDSQPVYRLPSLLD